jgi:hypothetical protein
MTPAWAQRQEALLSDCIVSPDVFRLMLGSGVFHTLHRT